MVIAHASERPLQVSIDAHAPAQPIPAQDGADYLKSVPGFSVIRKGGTDGDPVLRGQAGSRLNILLDGQNIFGGCGNRMDPPTAYVFPAAYDRITVLKGPQTVLYGPGNSAGVVLFERDTKRFARPGVKLDSALTLGSFGRNDEALEVRAGVPDYSVQASATRSEEGNYEDGGGASVHSKYYRWSTNAALGWTPDDATLVELSAARSNGQAAYADRMMDGSRFARENLAWRGRKQNLSPVVQRIEGQIYYNYVDHVMDNFTLRPFIASAMMPGRSASNPDRKTYGGRATVELALADATKATVGVDLQNNRHSARSTSNETTDPFEVHFRMKDAAFENYGLFGEVTQSVSDKGRIVGGARVDRWRAEDDRATVAAGMSVVANPTANLTRTTTLDSGFLRYEQELGATRTSAYLGVGYVERFPDYWELISKESATTVSAFNTAPEKTTQGDTGLRFGHGAFTGSVSAFANTLSDFILIQSNFSKPSGMMGKRAATITRNVDASTWGGEATATYRFAAAWSLDGSLACVQGRNKTDSVPLAQMPPLEARLGLSYASRIWSVGGLARMVAAQRRFALNQGNIVGQDLGPTGGFTIFSLNAGWRPTAFVQVTAGVDNLFGKTYAEFISHGGSSVGGFTTTTRVNEPGRTAWVKVRVTY